MSFKEALGLAIKKVREKKGYSQSGLARAVELKDRNQIHRIEIGASYPGWSTLHRICEVLDVHEDYLVRCARRDSNPQPAGYQLLAA